MRDFSKLEWTVLIRGKFHDCEDYPTHISTGIHDLKVGEAACVHIWRQPGDGFLGGLNQYQRRVGKLFVVYRGHGIDLDTREVDEGLEYIVIRIR